MMLTCVYLCTVFFLFITGSVLTFEASDLECIRVRWDFKPLVVDLQHFTRLPSTGSRPPANIKEQKEQQSGSEVDSLSYRISGYKNHSADQQDADADADADADRVGHIRRSEWEALVGDLKHVIYAAPAV